MTKAGQKSSPTRSLRRNASKIQRDRLNLEYLRHCRDEAMAVFDLDRSRDGPLSVYDTRYFPIYYQFKEEKNDIGKIRYSYNEYKMPDWNDITNEMKLGLLQLASEEWGECLFTFNPHIHEELLRELYGRDRVKSLAKRMARYLKGLGYAPSHYAFVVEEHGKNGKPTRLHIHGMALVSNDRQAKAVTEAAAKAAGQIVKGRGKLPSGSHGRFCYFEPGKSLGGYMLKNADKRLKASKRRNLVISREATQFIRIFYNRITGRDADTL